MVEGFVTEEVIAETKEEKKAEKTLKLLSTREWRNNLFYSCDISNGWRSILCIITTIAIMLLAYIIVSKTIIDITTSFIGIAFLIFIVMYFIVCCLLSLYCMKVCFEVNYWNGWKQYKKEYIKNGYTNKEIILDTIKVCLKLGWISFCYPVYYMFN